MSIKNTNYLKFFIALLFSAAAVIGSYYFWSKDSRRSIATENAIDENLTETQKQKWSVVEFFQFRLTNESLQIDIPHLVDLCSNNTFISFQFSAYEVSVAGINPSLYLKISCNLALEKMQTQFEINFSDMLSLQQQKELRLPFGELKSESLYSDEVFPAQWNIRQISIEGLSGFEITQFEIKKVFGNNFEFELGHK